MIAPISRDYMRLTAAFLLIFSVAANASAGLTYHFESTTEGVSRSRVSGSVKSNDRDVRMDIEEGDGLLLPTGGVVISRDGGRTLRVADLQARTYYDVSLDEIAAGASGLLAQMGDAVKMTVTNPSVTTRDLGAAGKIEGFNTRHSLVETSHDLQVIALGQKMTIRIATRNEVWTTDQLPGVLADFLQMRTTRTGIAAIDSILAAQQGKVTGFPLRQVMTVKVTQNGQEMTTTTKVVLTDVLKRNIAPSMFTLPPGLTKKPGPLDSMFVGR